jgi:hypothetical protein
VFDAAAFFDTRALKGLKRVGDRPWSKHDDGELKRIAREGRSLKEAAAILERSIDDVQRRLKELGSRMPGAGPQNREPC